MRTIGTTAAAAVAIAWLLVGLVRPAAVRRWGSGAVVVAVVAVVVDPSAWTTAAMALTMVTWLADRGVPGNRPRPWWIVGSYVVTIGLWALALVIR